MASPFRAMFSGQKHRAEARCHERFPSSWHSARAAPPTPPTPKNSLQRAPRVRYKHGYPLEGWPCVKWQTGHADASEVPAGRIFRESPSWHAQPNTIGYPTGPQAHAPGRAFASFGHATHTIMWYEGIVVVEPAGVVDRHAGLGTRTHPRDAAPGV